MTTGEMIKKLREDAGLSRLELAEKIGVSKSLVSNYENDSYKASENFLQKLAGTLGVPIETISNGITDNKKQCKSEKRKTFEKPVAEPETTVTVKERKPKKASQPLRPNPFSANHFQDKLNHIGYQLNSAPDDKYVISNNEYEFYLTGEEIADLNEKCNTYLRFLLSDF